MLPYWVQHDFEDVLAEMRQAGFALQEAWFAPHLEFRFPLVGQFNAAGVHIT